jgi:SagB-type dehydrogenase family enzyme
MVIGYHERTKHHFHRYARSAGYMDWDNQPNPFRHYHGAKQIDLPVLEHPPETSYTSLFDSIDAPGKPFTIENLSSFLQLSMGLSAWKQSGAGRWALRVNPSSGNLHPTETHLILPAGQHGLCGVYHYHPLHHALEERAVLSDTVSSLFYDQFSTSGFILALTTIFWRESWKYGERALRYCNLDVGHALAAITLSARINRWDVRPMGHVGDEQTGSVLGFNQVEWPSVEEEVPELMCWVSREPLPAGDSLSLSHELVENLASLNFAGKPNALCSQPVKWSIITETARAAQTPSGGGEDIQLPNLPVHRPLADSPRAADIIRQRRSAVRYDPRKSIHRDVFDAIVGRTLPRNGPPFSVAHLSPSVLLLFFVHRVTGMSPGLYLLDRVPQYTELLREAADPRFAWRSAHDRLPLQLLQEGDLSYEAMELSCHQEIAGNSAFCVSMIAYFQPLLAVHPHRYRHLHWECGMIGQLLYLEAEAQGVRGTGIGCFFDDGVHELLGLKDNQFQCLYHFTIGHPIEDTRVTTLPAYQHLKR